MYISSISRGEDMTQGPRVRAKESQKFWLAKIDKKLHYRFKLECLKRQVTMNDQLEELVREFLKRGK
jgi:hypothetical protein